MPMSGAGAYHNTMTVATKRDGGLQRDRLRNDPPHAGSVRTACGAAHRAADRRQRAQRLSRRDGCREGAAGLDQARLRRTHARDHLGLRPARLHGSVRTARRRQHDRAVERLFRLPCRRGAPAWRRGAEIHGRRVAGGVSDRGRGWREAGGDGGGRRGTGCARRARPAERRRAARRWIHSAAGIRCAPASRCTKATCSSAISARRNGSTSR